MNPTLSQIDLLARGLDVAGLRQRVIAQNVANINTPEYKRIEVAFDDVVADQIAGTPPQVVEAAGGAERADGNNVSLEQEMTDLNKNSLLYSALSQFLGTRLAQLRSAISGQ